MPDSMYARPPFWPPTGPEGLFNLEQHRYEASWRTTRPYDARSMYRRWCGRFHVKPI